MGRVSETAERIRTLDIQGAESIAREGLLAWAEEMDLPGSGADGRALARLLAAARPNEPMLRNLLAQVLGSEEVSAGCYSEEAHRLLAKIEEDGARIAATGAQLLPEGGVVFTHCHSSTVIRVLVEAHRRGKRFAVRNTETRPRYQGRKTAAELAAVGIEVEHWVDGAATWALEGADLFLFGADAVIPPKYFLNKVGTALFCRTAGALGVPCVCAVHTLKVVRDRKEEAVEARDPAEVWAEAPPGVTVRNPAFDPVPIALVDTFLTERGAVSDLWALPGFRHEMGCATLL